MYPYLFGVERLPMYGILLAIGLLSAVLLFKLICAKKKVDDNTYTFYSLVAIISIAMGLIGAFVFQAIYNAIYNAVNHLTGSAKESGGLTFMGGLITGVVVYILGTLFFAKGKVKRDFFECASYAAPCIVAGHMFGRLGCFCAGCCYGKETNSFLGVQFPGDSYKCLPTQLFEALFLAVLLAVMLVLLFKFDRYKLLLPLYALSYAVWRFCIEYARGDYRGTFIPGISPSQAQSILLLLVGAALIVLVYKFGIIPFAKAKDPVPKPAAAEADTTVVSADESPEAPAADSSPDDNQNS